MKLIVGIGNPGKEYTNTRHNIGFMVLDYLADKYETVINKKKHNGLYTIFELNNEKVILLKPLSYVNLSGSVVKKYMDYYKISINDILIIHDDLDTETGRIKVVKDSGSGGHNGIKSIESVLNTKDYLRLKIGISNNKEIDTKNYVLDTFIKADLEVLDKAIKKLENIIEDFINLDYPKLTNKYNQK